MLSLLLVLLPLQAQPPIERWEPSSRAIVEGLALADGTLPPEVGSMAWSLGGPYPWIGQTGSTGSPTGGQLGLDTAGRFVAGTTPAERGRFQLAVLSNLFARTQLANRLLPSSVPAWRSWTYESAGRPEWNVGGDPVRYPWDEPLYGDVKRGAAVWWRVDYGRFTADNGGVPPVDTEQVGPVLYGRVRVWGDEPNHAGRYALHALALRPENRGRFQVQLLGQLVDAQDAARLALFLAGQAAADEFAHPWVQAHGTSDRAFARGFSTILAAGRAGVLQPRQEEAAAAFARGALRSMYGVTPGANVNVGKGSPTMSPPFGDDEPVYQFFGWILAPATLEDLARYVEPRDPAYARELRRWELRLVQWALDCWGDPALPAPGYVTVPPALREPGKPLPYSLEPYVSNGQAVRHYGDGTELAGMWGTMSLACAARVGLASADPQERATGARAAAFVSAIVSRVVDGRMTGIPKDPRWIGWLTDADGNPLVLP